MDNLKREAEILESEPHKARQRLFKNGRPTIRPFTANDLKWIWAAYKHGSFERYGWPTLTQEDLPGFFIGGILSRFQSAEIIEDKNPAFSSGSGPIAIVASHFDGWRLEPHVDVFKWATPRNVLRGTVAFMQKSRYRKDVGVVLIRSLKEHKALFDHVEKYGVCHQRGRIPHGDRRGDEFLYSIRGNQRIKL